MTYSDLTYGRQRLAGASLLVFLNKADVTGGMLEDEVRNVCLHAILQGRVLIYQALKLDDIRTHKWIIIRCSAITGENLMQGLDWVVQKARDSLFLY